jgi:ArsR family transcriptional regulator, lead/cadmium/zinc/bismuth-responsive transcriptional repressor
VPTAMLAVRAAAIRAVAVMPDSVPKLEPVPQDEEALCCASSHPVVKAAPVLSLERATQMAELLGLLADPNRLRLLSILATEERCVGDLAGLLGMNESAVSHQLRTLRALRLVSARKQGRHVFYHLHDHHVLSFYQAVIEHLNEVPITTS